MTDNDALLSDLDADSKESVYVQLRKSIADGLVNNRIQAGQQISSMRTLALQLGTSSAAVRKAFNQLVAEGWLEVRQGSGTFVSNNGLLLAGQFSKAGATHTANQFHYNDVIPHTDTQADARGPFTAATIRKFVDATIFGAPTRSISEIIGMPIQEACSGTRYENAINAWKRDCQSMPLSLSEPAGYLELREQIANWLNQSRGMRCLAANVIIMNSVAECRNFVARLFIDRGTAMMVEDPGVNSLWIRAHNADLRPVGLDDSGLIPDELEALRDVRLAYVTSSSQCPTGAVLSRPRRQRILEWADRNNALIIEDDTNCEFTYESRLTPSIHSIDASDRTLYLGALGAILPASMQLAFVVVPPAVRAPFTRLKSIASRCTSTVVQRLAFRLFETEFVHERIRKLQRLLELRRAVLLEQLRLSNNSRIIYSPTKSGIFQTIWLSSELDDVSLAQSCFREHVLPISPFYVAHVGRPGLMLSFAQRPETIVSYMQTLLASISNQDTSESQR
jgi:GntR family transcriptional regulator/MocR family aminotransferase